MAPSNIIGFVTFKPRFKKLRKRALLSYLVQPVLDFQDGFKSNRFSNNGIAINWVRALNELGYEVDIINWDDKKIKADEDYDLVVVHGGKNYSQLKKQLKPGYVLIYFSTGTYWKFGNRQEDARLMNFKTRHGLSLPRDRYIRDSEEAANDEANGIIALGNQFTRETYSKYDFVMTLNNANYPDNHFEKVKKNYDQARNSWLFFAGAGNIHKGLDLAIDAFTRLDQNLYVITVLEKKFVDAYKQQSKLPNIHLVGQTPMRTEKFYEIIDKCAFQIFPSCSEGQPGSVLEAMHQGLVPVASRQSGLDADQYGEILKENSVECIQKTVKRLSSLEPAKVEAMSKYVRQVTLRDHNPDKFLKDLKKAVRVIVKNS